MQWLGKRSARQLVIVRYAPGHPVNQEWVYNGADIDGSKIVRAREMGEDKDRRLSGSRGVVIENGRIAARVVPYKS
jgi:hypothetical protein